MNEQRITIRAEAGWRARAIERALKALPLANNGVDDIVLHAIHESKPGCSTLTVYAAERFGFDAFLAEHCVDARSLLDGSALVSVNDHGAALYYDWLSTTWRGEELEVAILPSSGTHLQVIWIADCRKALEALEEEFGAFCLRPAGRALRYNNYQWTSATDIDAELGTVLWDDVVLPESTIAAIRSAVEGFFANRPAYEALGFPWKRGILLVGPPGTGKTTVCKAAAASLPALPLLYVEHIADVSQIGQVFQRARNLAPCILVFEDIDSFVNSSNRAQFLNEIDGFRSNDGILIIASSNHPERIDEALLKRPSRFDQVFHVGLPEEAERRTYCRGILMRSNFTARLADTLDIEDLADQIAARTEGFTPAYLKEVFISAALLCAQEGMIMLDKEFAVAALEQADVLRGHLKRVKDPASLAEMHTYGNSMGLRR